jgi:hypothetical protein
MSASLAKRVGDPCPKKCGGVLLRRRATLRWRDQVGDAAFCPRCNAAWEIEGEEVFKRDGSQAR